MRYLLWQIKVENVLVGTLFGVGFVTPVMFSNIAEAANFGKGGTAQWLSNAVLNKTDATKCATSSTGSSSITDANCVVFHGVKFKIVAVDNATAGQNAKVTLWSYDTSLSTTAYNSGGSWGSNINKGYANSDLKTAMDNLYSTTFASDSRIQQVTLAGETIASTTIAYQEKDTTDTIKSYVWAPSYTEVMDAGTWGFSSDYTAAKSQRAIGYNSWLRSPDPAYGIFACLVYSGYALRNPVDYAYLLRPALQILNQTSCVFTTNVTIPTDGVFTADGDTQVNYAPYALNSDAVKLTFAPATNGVTLDGTKIGITTTASTTKGYVTTGLLTEEADSTKNDTWANLNGTTANIAYMAQVSSNELDLSGVATDTDYTLKVFGLRTADTTVTELADNAVNGLSIVDGKIHMKVSSIINNGVGVTLKNGAVVDMAGDASNPVTVQETSDAGKLNLGAFNYEYSGNITDNGILTVEGTGTLVGTVSGAGKVVIDGTISADASKFTQTGGLEVKNNLTFTSSGLDVSDVGGFTQAAGSNVTVDASKIQADSNDHNQALFTGVDVADKLNVSAGKLTLTGAVQDGKYYVLVAGTAINGGTVTENTVWEMENISFPDILMADYEIKYDTNTADNPGSIALHVTNATTKEEGNTSGLAAVQQGNITVAKEFTGEVESHLGMIATPKLVEKGKYDKEIWATYINTKETTEGMKLEGIEGNNTAQYNGVVVGVDFYSSKKAIAGLALGYITGDIDSYSGNTFTRNKSKYYGVSFYDRVTNGNTALIYDIGYIRGDNDINQYYNGRDMTSDVKTDTYTAGVRYEAEFGTEKSRVVPFASFRYMRQNNKDYTNSHNTRFEAKNQNIYIPKVGIAWTGDFVAPNSVCTWRPSVEVGYLWNLGDRSAESMVHAGTLVSPIDYDVVDRSSFYGKAGMEFMCKNFTAGLFYRYLKGNAVRNNKLNVNMSWAF